MKNQELSESAMKKNPFSQYSGLWIHKMIWRHPDRRI